MYGTEQMRRETLKRFDPGDTLDDRTDVYVVRELLAVGYLRIGIDSDGNDRLSITEAGRRWLRCNP